ncbi:MAG: hypothetical protein M1827_001138 [Pycnora praestabilis]|nr:MAG: hypothetical protein M1827_001138 [Pycnora praestabilis]
MATTMSSSSAPPTLSFPPQTFAKLSPHPFLLAHLAPSSPSQAPLRPNGRAPTAFRSPTINTSSLSHASGSAVVRIGDTAVVCGIRGEILLASDVPGYRVGSSTTALAAANDNRNESAELNLLVPNLELSTGCSPVFLPGQPPSPLAQTLSQRILALLLSSRLVKEEDLRIWYQAPLSDGGEGGMADGDEVLQPEVKAFWCLYIDILFISLDGNPFDAAWAAVLTALRDTKLPHAWWDSDREMILCSEEVARARRLELTAMPLAANFVVFATGKRGKAERWLLADPDTFEEGLCREVISVVVDFEGCKEGRVLRIEKSGGGVIGKAEMREIVDMAGERWKEWRKVLGSVS